jgi:hypothetical protein
MWNVDSCYAGDGDLGKALMEAAEKVRRIGETCVLHVVARKDENGAGWVDVVFFSARPA